MKSTFAIFFICGMVLPLLLEAQVQVTGSGPDCLIESENVDNVYSQQDLPMNGKPVFFTLPDVLSGIVWNFNGENKWIIASLDGTVWYEHTADTPSPPETGWVKVTDSPTCNDGAALVLAGNVSPLPVELVYFKAGYDVRSGQVSLQWKTATEADNQGFTVERSMNGITWQHLGFVEGHGTTQTEVSYSYEDEPEESGVYYYRLKQQDFDGQFNHLGIDSVEVPLATEQRVRVFPNPAPGIASVAYPGRTEPLDVLVFNQVGQVVKRVRMASSDDTLRLEGVPAGMYYLHFISQGTVAGYDFARSQIKSYQIFYLWPHGKTANQPARGPERHGHGNCRSNTRGFGGTIAFITGIYERLINAIKSVLGLEGIRALREGGLSGAWKAIDGFFLLFLVGGMAAGIIAGAFGVSYLLETYPEMVWAFFFGLIVASAIYIGRQVRPWNTSGILALVVGIAVAYWITIANPAGGNESPVFIFFAGAIAISALILPGISGSFILLLLGMYQFILHQTLKEGVLENQEPAALITLGIFALGCLLGLATFSRVLSWTFKRYKNTTLALLTGFMIGSLNKVMALAQRPAIPDQQRRRTGTLPGAERTAGCL